MHLRLFRCLISLNSILYFEYTGFAFSLIIYVNFVSHLTAFGIFIPQSEIEPEPPCHGNSESQPLDHQGNPCIFKVIFILKSLILFCYYCEWMEIFKISFLNCLLLVYKMHLIFIHGLYPAISQIILNFISFFFFCLLKIIFIQDHHIAYK